MKWKNENKTENDFWTPYDDKIEELKKFNKELWATASSEQKQEIIDKVTEIYHGIEFPQLPLPLLNENGIKSEIQKCIDFEPKFNKEDVVNTGAGIGTKLCNFLFPNLWEVQSGHGSPTAHQRFLDKKWIKQIIKFAIPQDGDATPKSMMSGVRMSGHTPSNFRPMNARLLYETFCPNDGVLFDFSGGFGGRMLGALTSKFNYEYIATEPNPETVQGLNLLGEKIKLVRPDVKYRIIQSGSEVQLDIMDNSVDFAFSSPPYFNLEQYNLEDENQCYLKYPELETWFENYVKGTIQNIYRVLKPNCYYAVNIADFKLGKKEINYVDRWIKMSENEGFTFVKQMYLQIPARTGVGKTDKSAKKEGIYVFRKEPIKTF